MISQSASRMKSFAVALAAASLFWSAGSEAGSSKTQGALGKKLYAQHCASCHGDNLQGQPNWRRRLPNGKLPAPPHDETGHTWHHPDWQLFEMTKSGRNPFAPANIKTDMPAFTGTLSDQEIRAVLEFIKSRWPEKISRRQAEITRNLLR